MNHFDTAMQGKRIVVTRAASQMDSLCRLLNDAGAEVVEAPLIEFKSLYCGSEDLPHLNHLAEFDWILFSSSNAIRFFHALNPQQEIPASVQIACVGKQSAKTCASLYRNPDFVPQKFSSQFLAEEIQIAKGQRMLYPCPVETASDLVESLERRGAIVTRWPIYETLQAPLTDDLKRQLRTQPDAITFASPSVVSSFCDQLPDYEDILHHSLVVCIGPMTQRRAVDLGIPVNVVPAEYTIPGMVKALRGHWAKAEDAHEG